MGKNMMKCDIPFQGIADIFQKHSLGKIKNSELLTGGEFNSVWKITTDDEKIYAIKIAPLNSIQTLTYEHDLIQSEVYAYEKLSALQTVHIPKLYGYSWSDEYPYQYLIMEFIQGEILWKAKLSKKEHDKVMFDLGRAMAEMHNIECESGFGYLQNGLKSTWKEAYLDMVDNIINDGKEKKAKIPYLKDIQFLIKENEDVLEMVKTPSYVHFDLWAGNIILKENEIYSIIDCERMMLGDIMGEFISLDYIIPFDVKKSKMLIDGYQLVSEKKLGFDNNEMIRLYLMRLYLGLIVNVETYYRYPKFSKTFYNKYNFSKKYIKVTIKELKKLMKNK